MDQSVARSIVGSAISRTCGVCQRECRELGLRCLRAHGHRGSPSRCGAQPPGGRSALGAGRWRRFRGSRGEALFGRSPATSMRETVRRNEGRDQGATSGKIERARATIAIAARRSHNDCRDASLEAGLGRAPEMCDTFLRGTRRSHPEIRCD
jgi:hypothetical protein